MTFLTQNSLYLKDEYRKCSLARGQHSFRLLFVLEGKSSMRLHTYLTPLHGECITFNSRCLPCFQPVGDWEGS